MNLELFIFILSIILTGLVVWIISAKYYTKNIQNLKEENYKLKNQNEINQNLINELKLEFSRIAAESINSQQENLIAQHSADLKLKMELFKAEEITPINNLLKEFKTSLEEYQKTHNSNTQEIKQAISTAEKYAKALTTDQNSKGEFGENLLEQLLNFAGLKKDIHYFTQFSTENGKPDFIIKLNNEHHIIVDSKVILKNYIEYMNSEGEESYKKSFISDITTCINNLAKRKYETIENLNQPGFILMYIPIEACVELIYTDKDFRKVIENANENNIIISGTSSLLVSFRLINQLWASQIQTQNIKNIISTGVNLYNNINLHLQGLYEIQTALNNAATTITKEINRFTTNNRGSILKEAKKLQDYGIIEQQSSKKSQKDFLTSNFENEKEKIYE